MSEALTAAAPAVTSQPQAAQPPETFLGEVLKVTRKWQSSLTLQGGVLAGAATFVAAKGPALLVALGLTPAIAGELVGDTASLMGAAGALMVFVGRLRLGDLR
jgi:hypothetical protein